MAVIGIDEVGRGCWAGPLVAAAVRLHRHIDGLNDSKKISKKLRTVLAQQIYDNGDVGMGWVTPQEVDRLGLTGAVRLAMQRAINELDICEERIIIDGNFNYLSHMSGTEAIIRADGLVSEVSAASIVAKVARDAYMSELGDAYQQWQFDKHVGYGTALHKHLLEKFGVSDIHRLSYKPVYTLLVTP